jgi:hypothetical protein
VDPSELNGASISMSTCFLFEFEVDRMARLSSGPEEFAGLENVLQVTCFRYRSPFLSKGSGLGRQKSVTYSMRLK